MKGVPIDRCATGIPGFDVLCTGGFVRNSVNAVIGGPGAGKSTFLLQFLWNGVTQFDENGLYVSFEPDVYDTFQDALTMGWDFSKYDTKGNCKFLKVSPKAVISGNIKTDLTKFVSKYEIKRACFDPVSIISMSLQKESEIREVLFDLVSLLKRLNVTVVLADETVDGEEGNFALGAGDTKTQFVKFLCDGLVELYSSGLGGESDRAIRITKMRRTAHSRGPVPFEITNSGLAVYSNKKKGM